MLCSECVSRKYKLLFEAKFPEASYEQTALQANFPFVSFYCFDHAIEIPVAEKTITRTLKPNISH